MADTVITVRVTGVGGERVDPAVLNDLAYALHTSVPDVRIVCDHPRSSSTSAASEQTALPPELLALMDEVGAVDRATYERFFPVEAHRLPLPIEGLEESFLVRGAPLAARRRPLLAEVIDMFIGWLPGYLASKAAMRPSSGREIAGGRMRRLAGRCDE